MSDFPITSKDQIIDIDTIKAECENLKTSADSFTKCSSKLGDAMAYLTAEDLSVDKKTYSDTLDQLMTYVSSQGTGIEEIAASIEEIAQQIYNTQCQYYQNYLDYLEYQKAQEAQKNG